MGSGNSPGVMQNQTRDENGVVQQQNTAINGHLMTLDNPGGMDPSKVNPYAGQYIADNRKLYDEFQNSAAGGAFNNEMYGHMQATQQAGLTSSLGNVYASRGLSGSSAELGGMNQAIQSNQMNWLNRQQSDQMRALQGMQGLNSQGYNETMGIQNQYNNFQQEMNQQTMGGLGMQQQALMANQQMWGSIIGSGLAAGGMAAGAG